VDERRILDLDQQAVESAKQYPRERGLFSALAAESGRPFVALVGPRGAGKTVLLRQMRSARPRSLYVSADTLDPEERLADVLRLFSERYRISSFFIDEIHFLKHFAAGLKQIYDFADASIWFSSSVALSLYSAAWDLSRRVVRHTLLPFSFREYLAFRFGLELDPLPLDTTLRQAIPSEHLRTSYRFEEYLCGGLFPHTLEAGVRLQSFENILNKILTGDIPSLEPSLTVDDLRNIGRTLSFVGNATGDEVNYSSTSRNAGVTKYKAERYLELLERSFVVRRVFPAGASVLKEPKVLLVPPYRLLYRPLEQCVGQLREDFFALAMDQHGLDFRYLKNTRGGKTPDFLIDVGGSATVVEVGGKNKGRSQFKGIDYQRKVVLYQAGESAFTGAGGRVPLHCIGFPA
jgi:predicted AAA+ superfamily ATPase